MSGPDQQDAHPSSRRTFLCIMNTRSKIRYERSIQNDNHYYYNIYYHQLLDQDDPLPFKHHPHQGRSHQKRLSCWSLGGRAIGTTTARVTVVVHLCFVPLCITRALKYCIGNRPLYSPVNIRGKSPIHHVLSMLFAVYTTGGPFEFEVVASHGTTVTAGSFTQ